MRNTTYYGLSYPESGDHTRTWEFWQTLATQVDTLLAGKSQPLRIANDVTIGDPAVATDNMLHITKASAGVKLENRHRVFPTASGGGQGTVVSSEIWENDAEVAQFIYRRDGSLFLKSGGAAGVSRPVPFAMATAFKNVSVPAATQGTVDWVFPAGRFSVAPLVFITSTHNTWMPSITALTTTQVTAVLKSYNNSNGPITVGVHLWAVQMTPTDNQG